MTVWAGESFYFKPEAGRLLGSLADIQKQFAGKPIALTCRWSDNDTLMIGDRDLDILAARRNGVRAVGVTWGYGTEAELTAAEAAALCRLPHDLPSVVGSLSRS